MSCGLHVEATQEEKKYFVRGAVRPTFPRLAVLVLIMTVLKELYKMFQDSAQLNMFEHIAQLI